MSIHWFPGHMLAARREAAATLGKTDVVLEVLDARAPHSSGNPDLESLRLKQQRPALKLLNKADVADPLRTRLWLDHFAAIPGTSAVALSAKNAGEVGKLLARARELAPHRGTRLKPLRLMLLGVPNVGKSTLMNALLKRRIAKVGDEPAVTKHQARHELSQEVVLVDTPGMTWPRMHPETGWRLAATYSIGRNAFDETEVAATLGTFLLAEYGTLVSRRYGPLPDGVDGPALVDLVGRARGLLLKGGAIDREKAAGALLADFREGTLGRITLETPAMATGWLRDAVDASKA